VRKWILVIVLLLAAIITAFTIFAVTGVIDAPALFWNLGMKIGWIEPHLKVYAIGQDAEQWIAGQLDELAQKARELEEREAALGNEQEQLEQRRLQLDAREASINAASEKLAKEQEQLRSVQTLAALYTEMGPEEAAPILAKLEQDLILDVLLSMDMAEAALVLTELPTDLAVALSKQLAKANE
jgi:flagellar motility protein MotE (MotC chaperone)